ncbi:unnamed protein product [Prunus armeniaca]|uniref:Uncharacterized protein n=1 Tax=Prunus armeniaca TaxID=36596 RepID=A0A6J5USQ8_PRUAR|nr:unnamed protein product [Prunus armeniaca]
MKLLLWGSLSTQTPNTFSSSFFCSVFCFGLGWSSRRIKAKGRGDHVSCWVLGDADRECAKVSVLWPPKCSAISKVLSRQSWHVPLHWKTPLAAEQRANPRQL